MKFLATTNTPGYLPMDDDPPTFDTAREAWAYLADERIRDEDAGIDAGAPDEGYSSIVNFMESIGNGTLSFEDGDYVGVASNGEGSIWGPSCPPKMYDLGLAYTVTAVEDETFEVNDLATVTIGGLIAAAADLWDPTVTPHGEYLRGQVETIANILDHDGFDHDAVKAQVEALIRAKVGA